MASATNLRKSAKRRASTAISLALAASMGLAACGSSDEGKSDATGLTGTCGTVPSKGLKDTSGVIKKLGSEYVSAYDGYPKTVEASPWADWKPSGPGPYTVGLSIQEPNNPYLQTLTTALKEALANAENVGEVKTVQAPLGSTAAQLQQINQLVQEKVDLLVVVPNSPDALAAAADKAAKQNIPTIAFVNVTPSRNVINIAENTYKNAANAAAQMAKNIGGKGKILAVHALPSVSLDKETFAGWRAAWDQCPGITVDDSPIGEFNPPVAKTQVSTYLGSHPQKVAASAQVATMGAAVISAFEQSGRPVPPMVDMSASVGSLAYWKAHKAELKSVAIVDGPKASSEATGRVVALMLAGHGPKVTDLVSSLPVVTGQNLDDYVPAGAKEDDLAPAELPSGSFLPDSYLRKLFN
ncbi:substrate-binding domain-containing protein [Aeromicrobium ginsengisoli]|nr:substrate-binding domain-containing protein [Aeromicrobium ginsengisoli]